MPGSGPLLAGVELGGTKGIAVLGRDGEVIERASFPTRLPEETLAALADVLARWRDRHAPAALGIASFGPISLDPRAADYGRLLATPKSGWIGADIVTPLAAAMGTDRVLLHTDVTGAALAEGRWGSAVGLADFVYVTIGTGIGMGVIVNGRPVTGRMHPEAGHLRIRRDPADSFPGICPFHHDCLEGLASGPAIAARAGAPAETLAPDHPALLAAARDIGEGFAALLLTLAPEAILGGGGVSLGQAEVLPRVRRAVVETLGGYLPFAAEMAQAEQLIRPAALGSKAGEAGALALAEMALAS